MNEPRPPHVPRLTPSQLHLLFRLGQLGTLGAMVALIWSAATSHWVALAVAAVTLLASLYLRDRFRPMTPQRWSAMREHDGHL